MTVGNCLALPCGNDKAKRKLRAAQDPVLDIDGRTVQFGDALHDREPKSAASLLVAIAPPEALEDQLALLVRNSGTAIEHRYRAIHLDDEFDNRFLWRVADGVLREIADRAFHHLGIALDQYRHGGAKQRDLPALLERQGRDELGDLGAGALQVRHLRGVERERLEFGDVEQLADHPAHRLDVQMQRLGDAGVIERLHTRAQDTQRRTQLMGGIRGEFSLDPETFVKAIERLVDRRNQWPDLAWDFVDRQADIGACG